MKTINKTCIIDDDEIFVIVAKKIMKVAKFSDDVLIFRNGKEAICHFRENQNNSDQIPDIIFLDLNMPLMDGWDFLTEIEKVPLEKEIRIFIFTSSIDPNDQKRSEGFKLVESFIEKPLTMEKLRNITNMLNENA